MVLPIDGTCKFNNLDQHIQYRAAITTSLDSPLGTRVATISLGKNL